MQIRIANYAQKFQGLNGIRTHDHLIYMHSAAVLYHISNM